MGPHYERVLAHRPLLEEQTGLESEILSYFVDLMRRSSRWVR